MSRKPIFTGSAVAIITPMNADGSINYDEFKRIIDDQIAGGTDAIVVCGTTGEASTMTHEEHIETIRVCCEHVNHRVPVIAGTGSNCTATSVYLSQEAEKAGADAVLLVSPYYNKATQAGLIKHFGDTAASISIPVILYNIPSRTGVNILPETVKKLVDTYDNIVAITSDERCVSYDGPVFYRFFEIAMEQLDFLWSVRREIMVVRNETGRFIQYKKTFAGLPFDFRTHAPVV